MITGVNVTFDIYRPFGGASTHTGISGTLTPDFACGRGSGVSGLIVWTHLLDVSSSTDILDGTTRIGGSNTLSYADGDEIRITGGATGATHSKYVVVFVEYLGGSNKRAYLMRDVY